MHRANLVVLLALALSLGSCSTPPPPLDDFFVRVVTTFDTEGLRVEGGVVSECAGLEGRDFDSALEERLALTTDGATPLPFLEEDAGLAARLLNDQCEVVGFGCLPVEASEERDLEILVEARAPRSSCSALDFCEDGQCVPMPDPDAGPTLPEGVTRSPDGAGYCFPLEGYTCDCTPLDYFCETLDCQSAERRNVCDAPPPDFVEIVDEHGCPGFELVPSGESCFLPRGAAPSPDGEGYCLPLEGYTCECTPLDYFVSRPDNVAEDGVCGAHPSSFVEVTDEHGCLGFEIVETEESCPMPEE